MAPRLTARELDYLRSQFLGRLATVDPSGALQNNPVGFVIAGDAGHVLIGGTAMGNTRKFRTVRRNPNIARVVDDLASTDPWTVRGVELRGTAEALVDVDPPRRGMSREVIRITPSWIASWGLDLVDGALVVVVGHPRGIGHRERGAGKLTVRS